MTHLEVIAAVYVALHAARFLLDLRSDIRRERSDVLREQLMSKQVGLAERFVDSTIVAER